MVVAPYKVKLLQVGESGRVLVSRACLLYTAGCVSQWTFHGLQAQGVRITQNPRRK